MNRWLVAIVAMAACVTVAVSGSEASSPALVTTQTKVGFSVTVIDASGKTPTLDATLLVFATGVNATDGHSPKSGMCYVAVDLEVIDLGPRDFAGDPSESLTVVDGRGNRFGSDLAVRSIDAGALWRRATQVPAYLGARGWSVFQIPVRDAVVAVTFASGAGGTAARWRLP